MVMVTCSISRVSPPFFRRALKKTVKYGVSEKSSEYLSTPLSVTIGILVIAFDRTREPVATEKRNSAQDARAKITRNKF